MPDNPNFNKFGADWYEHGKHDLASAKIIYREDGFTDTIAVLLQQAAEKYLKGYLLSKGWKLKKTHDLELLVSEAMDFDSSFSKFLDYSRIVSAFYITERYPPSTPIDYPREEISLYLKQTEQLITKILE